jgi:hypothetical protein
MFGSPFVRPWVGGAPTSLRQVGPRWRAAPAAVCNQQKLARTARDLSTGLKVRQKDAQCAANGQKQAVDYHGPPKYFVHHMRSYCINRLPEQDAACKRKSFQRPVCGLSHVGNGRVFGRSGARSGDD